MTGRTCFNPRKTPTTFTSSTRRKSASGYSAIGWTDPSIPALLKKISIWPAASSARETKPATEPSSVTSPSIGMSSAGRSSSSLRRSNAALSRSTATIRAPRAIMSLTVAAPISPAAPVIRATFPSRRLLSSIRAAFRPAWRSSRSVRARPDEPTGLDWADGLLELQDRQHTSEPDVLTCHHHQFEQFAFGEVPPQLADHRVVDCKVIERHGFGETQRGALPRREGTLGGTIDIERGLAFGHMVRVEAGGLAGPAAVEGGDAEADEFLEPRLDQPGVAMKRIIEVQIALQ